MYAKRLIINLMLCCAFENSYAGKSYSNFTKHIFYLIFIIAPLSGTFVGRAMEINLKLEIKEYLDLYLEITRLHTTFFSQKSTLLRYVTNAFKICSYCYIRVCFSLIFLLI